MAKYPNSERVTAGKLKVGDRLLVRDRKSDHLPSLPHAVTGVFEVVRIDSHLERSYSRSTRYYQLDLLHPSGETFYVRASQVQRVNRVTEVAA